MLVVEDGPTITHGGMPYGAGHRRSTQRRAPSSSTRGPFAVGSIAETFARYPDIGPVLPAMGYGDAQVADLEATIRAAECDVVVTGTPIDLDRLDAGHPMRHVTYELEEVGPALRDALTPHLVTWR